MKIDQEACLFSGSSHSHLAHLVAKQAELSVSAASIRSFPDGEISIQIQENVRGKTAFVVQSLAHRPNHYLMELLIMVDALKRASAKSIVVLLPYFAYARQDRKDKDRVPITAKLVANLLEKAGVNRILTMDLHSDQIQGFFDIPVDHLLARPALLGALQSLDLDLNQTTLVAPDIGSVKWVKKMADALSIEYAIIDKRRLNDREVDQTAIIGEVQNRHLVFLDDLCSTATTLCEAANTCKKAGALSIHAAVTHGLFADGAIERLEASPIETLLITDTVAQKESHQSSKIKSVSIAHLFGEAIKCVMFNRSITSLFTPQYNFGVIKL